MPYQPESFYETTLASAITATQDTIPVTVAPNILSGYLVIESNTTNREIIKYTGVTGTTLTGCVRGLATYGSDDSAGTGKAHSAGVDIANKDVHYYYAQYYDFLVGTSATGANIMRIGDGAAVSTANRFWYVNTSSVSAFWGLSSNGTVVVSEDGITSYVVSAGGSGIAAGSGIDITAGVASISLLSTGGLRTSADKLAVEFGQGLSATSANELYVDQTTDYTWTGDHIFNGQTTFKNSCVFESSGSVEFNSDIIFNGETNGINGLTFSGIAGEAINTYDMVGIYVVSACATADSYTYSLSANTNFGSSNVVSINSEPGSGIYRYGYFKWNVSSFPASASKAFIRLNNTTGNGNVNFARLSTDWVEGSITYNNGPTAGTAIHSLYSIVNGYNEIDITDTYNGWRNGTYNNYGIVLNTGANDVDFTSRNAGTNDPILFIYSNNRIGKSKASDVWRTSGLLGVSLGSVSAGQDLYVQTNGKIKNSSWNLITGNNYYLGNDGTLSASSGTNSKLVGKAVPSLTMVSSTDTLLVNIEY